MRFVLYSELTVSQCMRALKERMEAPESKSRPSIEGIAEKDGRFVLTMTGRVMGGIQRKTRLRGHAERENGVTVITGFVPSGVPPQRIAIVIGAMLLVGLVMLLNGSAILGIMVGIVGFGLYVPLVGDYNNSDYLHKELKKATKGKLKSPK